ncbi:MFS transporter [Carbonactinospora thermoautotrophica]|uniref:MFS transporter n=1 Tax=Carbonactinospora thermoautotrophica TaxID=1469144 RepID=A0A132MJ30_9ACTN|nr:MFS transporter [Carbonactinospora thermoautotrophica]KWW97846.1 MFS transporter [Carbonactinospora thermoautotrophica]KWW98406.1 Major facilitator superfamily MFS_1 [Carbonactinospora thermoautotrophica]KWX08143.1 MFS transporter [Carbonactinospora thermoautotrophica]
MTFLADLRAVIGGRDFRRLYATRLVSQFTDGLFNVALTSYVFFSPERQPTAGQVAAAFATLLLPYSVVGPFVGVLLDRWRRRQVLVYCNLLRSAMALGVAGLVWARAPEPLFYAAVLATLGINRFFLAGLSAALPHVVAADKLVMANAVSPTSGTLVATLGAAAGFVLNQLAGAGRSGATTLIATAACGYLAAAQVARLLPVGLLGPHYDPNRPQTLEALRNVAVGMADGARHVWERRPAGHALAAIAAQRFLYGLSLISVILLFRNYFNPPEATDAALAGLGTVVAISGLGFFAAAAITPVVTGRASVPAWIVTCLLLAAVGELVFGVPYQEMPLLFGAFLLGFVAQGVKICVDTIVQQEIDDAYRGRVFSLYDVVFNVSFVSAAFFAALALPPTGKSYLVLVLSAVGYALIGLVYWWRSRRYPTGQHAG